MPIYAREGGYKSIQITARKRVTVDLLALGADPLTTHYKTLDHSLQKAANVRYKVYSLIRQFFESSFGNTMTYDEIVNHRWTYEGWVEFYGLKKGMNY